MENDILGHLIDIEHNAASMLLDAQIEADKRIAEARIKAESVYKIEYEQLLLELEKDFDSQITVIASQHVVDLEVFKKELDSTKQDPIAFNALINTLLLEE